MKYKFFLCGVKSNVNVASHLTSLRATPCKIVPVTQSLHCVLERGAEISSRKFHYRRKWSLRGLTRTTCCRWQNCRILTYTWDTFIIILKNYLGKIVKYDPQLVHCAQCFPGKWAANLFYYFTLFASSWWRLGGCDGLINLPDGPRGDTWHSPHVTCHVLTCVTMSQSVTITSVCDFSVTEDNL